MRYLILTAALLASGQAFAQSASQTIANQIGQLVIQNANLSEQVSRLQTENEKLKKDSEGKDAKQNAKDGADNGGSGAQPGVR